MRLESLSIIQLYGSLSIDIQFNPDLNLLVGINGSGKTSALNVIEWLLKPNLNRLTRTKFSLLSLKCSDQGRQYTLEAVRHKTEIVLSVAGALKRLKPITIPILGPGRFDDEDITSPTYPDAGIIPSNYETIAFLRSLPSTTLISLDRTISAEGEDLALFESPRRVYGGASKSRPPLSYVQEVANEKYAEYRIKAIAADDALKAAIVMSALEVPQFPSRRDPVQEMSPIQIERLEQKVTSYLSKTIKTGNVERQVRRFFQRSRAIAEDPGSKIHAGSRLGEFVTDRYRQIESLARAFNDFETVTAEAFRDLKCYLDAVNQFLGDSNKRLTFQESTGSLAVYSGSADQFGTGPNAISTLSSGERQILILFTLLAFSAKSQSAFIVDEPEISLHPKWQSDFMDGFLRLRPAGTQLLIATHSPDIVGKHKRYCIVLRGSH